MRTIIAVTRFPSCSALDLPSHRCFTKPHTHQPSRRMSHCRGYSTKRVLSTALLCACCVSRALYHVPLSVKGPLACPMLRIVFNQSSHPVLFCVLCFVPDAPALPRSVTGHNGVDHLAIDSGSSYLPRQVQQQRKRSRRTITSPTKWKRVQGQRLTRFCRREYTLQNYCLPVKMGYLRCGSISPGVSRLQGSIPHQNQRFRGKGSAAAL